jgi:anti-sigma regulatory factor (Ser/Thr protein kinase)
MGTIRLTIPGRLDRIQDVTTRVGEAAHNAGFDNRESYVSELAVAEACENIIKHGYGAEDLGTIQVAIHTSPGHLIIDLEDHGPPFNPAVEPETREWTPDDPPVGGLGLLIIHRAMDRVRYTRTRSGNRLRLEKSIQPRDPSA